MAFFELMWDRFPNKEGKEVALQHYLDTVKTYDEMDDIERAIGNYREQFSDQPQPPGWGHAGSWWFQRWQYWHEEYEYPDDGLTHIEVCLGLIP